jgi:DNA (cytosine-5)-methyltransferase 1
VHSIEEPLRTVTASRRGDHALVAPTLIQTGHGERPGQAPRTFDILKPLTTVVAGGQKHGYVAAFLSKHNGGHEATGSSLHDPADTITARDSHALTTATLAPTDHSDTVRAFLKKFQGRARNTLKVNGVRYAIVDIGMRMLQPRELFRAQSFSDDYIIDRDADGNPLTKTAQIKLAGNSVPPEVAAALVRANYGDRQAVAA